MKKFAIALAASHLALVTAATAQTGAWIEIDDDALAVDQFQMTVDELEDMDVVNMEGEVIGEVEEVLGTADGTATAFAVEIGGFLGIGETDAIVPFDQVTAADGELQVEMDAAAVEALERWND
jgi:sporulation protein YlmC with PRC-barrel domain